MNQKEKELLKSLCNFKADEFEESLLEYATPRVLGYLFFNRMQAVAYGVLKEKDLLGRVNREFRNSLKGAYEQNVDKNHSFFQCVQSVVDILSSCGCRYAMLKGAVLCKRYPSGYRTSNDIDLLVRPKDVTLIGQALASAGFQQGNVRNDRFVPAARREIIESKMMRGETVPYIKEIGLSSMNFLEVDINFSMDYKNSEEDILDIFLDRTQLAEMDDLVVPTLEKSDFFLHLCSHLYKEASTLPWVKMNRDMTLYKYCDIYLLLSEMTSDETACMFERARQIELDKVCSYAILQTAAFFAVDNQEAIETAQSVLKGCPDWIHTVISPEDNKEFLYNEKDIEARFFMDRRIDNLQEMRK